MDVKCVIAVFVSANSIIFAYAIVQNSLDFGYHSYDDVKEFFEKCVRNYPHLVRVDSIGHSVRGLDLKVMKITANWPFSVGTPHVKLIGTVHGNEVVGKELLLHFIQELLVKYENDSEIQSLVNSTVLHILPILNPDGLSKAVEGDCFSSRGRENANGVDLNRSFPDRYRNNSVPHQPETSAVINWLSSNQFVLSASFHGGALVANYPWDSLPDSEKKLAVKEHSLSPDDDVFKLLASTYANYHATMHTGLACAYYSNVEVFPGGITAGAAWYSLTGGMQDYNYFKHGTMELTLEVSCCKYPPADQLQKLWQENRKAIFELVKKAQYSIRGQILNALSGEPVKKATLRIRGRSIPFYTSDLGEYWRILMPGDYILEVSAEGYFPESFPITVKETKGIQSSTPLWLTGYMRPRINRAGFIFSAASRGKTAFYLIILILFKTLLHS